MTLGKWAAFGRNLLEYDLIGDARSAALITPSAAFSGGRSPSLKLNASGMGSWLSWLSLMSSMQARVVRLRASRQRQ